MDRILVIDDEAEIIKILEKFLTKMSFDVVSTSDGEEGIRLLNEGTPFNLLIVDMKMPRVRGIDILQNMAKNNIKIPVIVLTGSFDEEKYLAELSALGYEGKTSFLSR